MGKPIRVLMVEDSEDDTLLVLRALKKGGYEPQYERVETAEAVRKAIEKSSWDVILCDYQMPKFSGLEAIVLLKDADIDLPLIIVSGAIGEETAVDCMRYGAQDYVMKGNLSRLVPAIERELKEAQSRVQRRQAKEALRESEENYRNLFQNAPIGIFHSVPEGRFLRVNHALAQMMGYGSPEEMVSAVTNINTQIYVDSKKRSALVAAAMENAGWIYAENRYRRKDGTILTANLTVRKVLNPYGAVSYLEGFIEDITDRKQAEDALRESETRFREMFDDAPIGYHELNSEGSVTRVNRTELAMLGYSVDEMRGRPVWELSDEKDLSRKEVLDKLAGVLPPGRNVERNYCRRDGTRVPVMIHNALIRDKDGKINGLRTTVQDMTYRKQADKQLHDTLESLRKAVGVTIQVMVSAVETRDPYTSGHQTRAAGLARTIAAEMGLPQDTIEGIRMAGSIHDIGKLSIPAEILAKPTKLSAIEFLLIKEHAERGYEILKDVESQWPLAEIVRQHHERMDGSGYPRNLKGEEILIEARILSVADVVEAMASHRPYRPGLGIDAALEEITRNRGILYDPEVTDACLKIFQEKGYRLSDLTQPQFPTRG